MMEQEKKCIKCLNHLLDFVIWEDPVFLDTMAFEGCISKSIGQTLREEMQRAITEMRKVPTWERKVYWLQYRNRRIVYAVVEALREIIPICEKETKG
jgi:hypothetical protein